MSKTHNWNYPNDLLEAAWGLIANSYGGDWSKASPEWREAAEIWRDAYHRNDNYLKSKPVLKTKDGALYLTDKALEALSNANSSDLAEPTDAEEEK